MSNMAKESERLKIACTGSGTIDFHELVEIQGGLKNRTAGDIERMRRSIETYGFSFPFFVWSTKTKQYVLDGHGRLEALRAMEQDGIEIPPLPIVEIEAKSRKEAKQKLLRLNSTYGEFTIEGIEEFTADISVDWDDIVLPSGVFSPDLEGDEPDEEYTRKIETPIYEPTGPQPEISSLTSLGKRNELLAAIETADVTDDERSFLRLAAERHTVFDYQAIAEYYAHAEPEMQRLMEHSALVIIDFEKAIEQGFVRMTRKISDLYAQEPEYDES